MPNVATKTADRLIEHQLDLQRVATSDARQHALLLRDLQTKLCGLLAARRGGWAKADKVAVNRLLLEARAAIRETYAQIVKLHKQQMTRVIDLERKAIVTIVNDAAGTELLK